MFRRQLVTLTAAAAVLCTMPAFAAQPGIQYKVLENPLPVPAGTLVKIYSYDCPFCFRYDTSVDPRILPRVEKEAGLKFMPIHLETRGRYGRTASEFFAMCMLRDEKAGISIEDEASAFKKARDAVYFAYHRRAERWTSGEAAFVNTMAEASGISAEQFEKERRSPEVVRLADSWKAAQPVARIQGIPAYVVNGKYLIMTRSIKGVNDMVELIKELALLK